MYDILLDLVTHQGRFEIAFIHDGQATLRVRWPSPDEEPGDSHRCYYSMSHWRHDYDLMADHGRFNGDIYGLHEHYRALFLAHDIKQTALEHPRDSLIPRVSIDFTLWNEIPVQIVFRADGHGFVIDAAPPHWAVPDERLIKFPCSPFRHTRSVHEIVRDMTALAGSGPDHPIAAKYTDLFWNEINGTLKYPWIQTLAEIESVPLFCRSGDLEELQRIATAAIALDDHLWSTGRQDFELVICVEADGEIASVSELHGDNAELTPEIRNLVSIMAQTVGLTGHEVYGAPYLKTARTWRDCVTDAAVLPITVKAPSATERMEAFEIVVDWANRQPNDLGSLLPA